MQIQTGLSQSRYISSTVLKIEWDSLTLTLSEKF